MIAKITIEIDSEEADRIAEDLVPALQQLRDRFELPNVTVARQKDALIRITGTWPGRNK